MTQLLPYPLDSGGKIKGYHFLKTLAGKHDVTLLSFVRSEEEAQYAAHLTEFCDRVETCPLQRSRIQDIRWLIKSWLSRRSFVIARDHSIEFQSKVDELLSMNDFDVLHVVRPNMFQYVPEEHSAYTVLDTENVEALIVRRILTTSPLSAAGLLSLFEWKKLQRYERAACKRADLVLTVTDEDKAVLTRLRGDSSDCTPIKTIPIGVDTSYFHYSWRPEDVTRAVFVGTMYWPPNVDSVIHFCRDILPLAREEIPELEFDIVGLRPAKSVLRLEKTCSGVRVTGSVGDVRPYMARSRVLVVPLRSGSGMRVKILNAMAVGVPVVTTSIGCEGIAGLVPVQEPSNDRCNDDANIWIADSPEDLSRAIVTLARDDELARTLSRNGRELVEKTYDWSAISKRIIEVYDRIEETIATRKQSAAVH